MGDSFNKFENIARVVHDYSEPLNEEYQFEVGRQHPFEERNIYPEIDKLVRKLFDDGHYSSATFEAFKFVDKKVQELSTVNKSGYKLMMDAFDESSPKIKLTNLSNTSEIDEQKGYRFIFSGSVMAIRNPRGHEILVEETLDQCLDHIGLASLLLRRLENMK